MISTSSTFNTLPPIFSAIQSTAEIKGAALQYSSFKPVEDLAGAEKSQLRSPRQTQTIQDPTLQEASAEPGVSDAVSDSKKTEDRQKKQQEDQELQRDQRIISELASRDREVKAHEQAHAAVGGQFAGSPSYQYERGPDGINYAVGGEVPIDVGRAATPEATLNKAQVVRRAALAPANPSPQDRSVAAQATRLETQARADINAERIKESQQAEEQQTSSEVVESESKGAVEEGISRPNTAESSPGSTQNSSQNAISSRTGALLTQVIANTAINPVQPGDVLSQIA